MITVNLHFGVGYECQLKSYELPESKQSSIRVGHGVDDIYMFFPTREIRDAVRDALLKCPGCVARPEAEAVPISPEAAAEVAALRPRTPPQPAVQAMEAAEEWA